MNLTVGVDLPFFRSTYCWGWVKTLSKGETQAQKIFVNLPVRDLRKSMVLHWIGFYVQRQFTDETAACMAISKDIFVMLLTENKFKTFTPKQICDATKSTEVLVCLSSTSRNEVNEMVRKAVAALEQRTGNRRTTVSCTVTDSRIWMGTFGSWHSWSQARLSLRQVQLRWPADGRSGR
jgi:predicted lactoylglutathione lyase